MKSTKLKRIIALVLSAAMVFSLASCGGSSDDTDNVYTTGSEMTDEEMSEAKTLAKAPQDGKDEGETVEVTLGEQPDKISDDDLRYVMIYNPKIYRESATFDNSVLKTGYFGNQIDVSAYRADGLDKEIKNYTISQKELMGDLVLNFKIENNRSDFMPKVYKEGDRKDFYCYPPNSTDYDSRVKKNFECVYVGEHCHIWSVGGVSVDKLKKYGKEFDENIFNQVIELFGEPRFSGKNGKVNLLFSDMPETIAGCFFGGDIFTQEELDYFGYPVNEHKYNTDHDILYINALYTKFEELESIVYSTMAHEFQHLICRTNTLVSGYESCPMWINETMSGYVEDYLYPGIQVEAGRYNSYNLSESFRKGQSLYNFETKSNDIGAYGTVYIFSRYLTKLAGLDIFTKMHSFWGSSLFGTVTEADAIYENVSSSYKSKIENSVNYPSSWSFRNNAEKFMSKLTLDFYVSVLSNRDDIDEFENIKPEALLYDEINEAEIEGGGRIIVAVNDTTFDIPDEADSGLVYVGLDEDFEVVTPFVCS